MLTLCIEIKKIQYEILKKITQVFVLIITSFSQLEQIYDIDSLSNKKTLKKCSHLNILNVSRIFDLYFIIIIAKSFKIKNQPYSSMQQLKLKFQSLNLPSHYLLYCVTFMLYATAMAGVGPLVPYLASKSGHKQTQYSVLFFCKSIGFFIGSLILNKIHDKKVFHTIMMWSSILLFILMTAFTKIQDFYIQSIIMILIATSASIINILINVCVVQIQKSSDVHFWMLVLHGTYGIGGLIGPIVIYIFQIQSYFLIGIFLGLLAPFYYRLKSPQANDKMFKWIVNSQFYQFESYNQASTTRTVKRKYISQFSQYILCFIFWTYIGIELGFANWISSYAVLENIDSKQQALRYNSIFWISMTVFRFISLLMPFRSMRKLIANEYLFIGFVALSLFLVSQNQADQACLLSSITFGICFSSMYPLLLSTPLDYNLKISASQMTQIALWSALGEAVVAPLFGLLMDWFQHNMLFYSLLSLGIVLLFATHYLQTLYQKDAMAITSSTSMELKDMLLTDSS